MNEQEKYIQIVGRLIRRSYPNLVNKKIKIKIKDKGKFSAAARRGLLSGYVVNINAYYCRAYSSKELDGLLAHELCHAEKWEERGFFKQALIDVLTLFPHFKEKEEKATDIRAICKGYRKELKSQKIKRWKNKDDNLNKLKKFYLTPKEVSLFNCSRIKVKDYLRKFNTSSIFI